MRASICSYQRVQSLPLVSGSTCLYYHVLVLQNIAVIALLVIFSNHPYADCVAYMAREAATEGKTHRSHTSYLNAENSYPTTTGIYVHLQ